jgi:hypothetical protein
MSYGYRLGLGLGLELGLLLRRGYTIGTHRIGIKPRSILLTSIKDIIIGTTSSAISYQLRNTNKNVY